MFKKCLLSMLMLTGLTVLSYAQPMELVFSVGAGNTVELPLYGTVSCTVDWGDGSAPDTVTVAGDLVHVFGSAGICTTSISGTVTVFGTILGWTGSNKLTEVITFGDIGLTSLPGAFRNADNLTSVPAALPSAVTGLSYAFAYINQTSITNLDVWDMGSVTDMSYMFFYAQNFNQDISGWDVSAARDMRGVFYAAQKFNQDIGGWNVSSATDMYKMFYYASAFNKSLDSWTVSSVTDMSRMFESASSFNGTIGSWNTGAVTNMSSMFHSAAAFNQDLGAWNVSSVTDMSHMFYTASKFNQDIGSWNVGTVTDMCSMFCAASVFNGDISTWDVSSVRDMNSMFYNADSFNAAIGGWDVDSVTTMYFMFGAANTFNQDISGWNTGAVTNMAKMFMSAPAFGQDIGSWDVSAVTDMSYMFYNADGFNHDIGGWDVGSVTDMRYMFCYNGSFDQDLGSWDVSSVTDMTSMLRGVTLSTPNYDSLLIGWETNGVQNGISFHGGSSMYYADSAQAARQRLIDNHGWTIEDGGLDPVPVELSSFTATLTGSGVLLRWTTETEENNLGFNVLRGTSEAGPLTRISSMIPGQGTTSLPQEYRFADETPAAGANYYVLEQVDVDGTVTRTDPVFVEAGVSGIGSAVPGQHPVQGITGQSCDLQGRAIPAGAARQYRGVSIAIDADGNVVKKLRLE